MVASIPFNTRNPSIVLPIGQNGKSRAVSILLTLAALVMNVAMQWNPSLPPGAKHVPNDLFFDVSLSILQVAFPINMPYLGILMITASYELSRFILNSLKT